MCHAYTRSVESTSAGIERARSSSEAAAPPLAPPHVASYNPAYSDIPSGVPSRIDRSSLRGCETTARARASPGTAHIRSVGRSSANATSGRADTTHANVVPVARSCSRRMRFACARARSARKNANSRDAAARPSDPEREESSGSCPTPSTIPSASSFDCRTRSPAGRGDAAPVGSNRDASADTHDAGGAKSYADDSTSSRAPFNADAPTNERRRRRKRDGVADEDDGVVSSSTSLESNRRDELARSDASRRRGRVVEDAPAASAGARSFVDGVVEGGEDDDGVAARAEGSMTRRVKEQCVRLNTSKEPARRTATGAVDGAIRSDRARGVDAQPRRRSRRSGRTRGRRGSGRSCASWRRRRGARGFRWRGLGRVPWAWRARIGSARSTRSHPGRQTRGIERALARQTARPVRRGGVALDPPRASSER